MSTDDTTAPGRGSELNAGLGLAPERAEVAHLDDGEAWSFCRTVMSDGRDIRQWHPDEGYEMQSARMDAQAARRGDQLMEMVRRLLAAERDRPRQVIAYMATNRRGEMRFTDNPDAARELEGYGWAITPLADAGPNVMVSGRTRSA